MLRISKSLCSALLLSIVVSTAAWGQENLSRLDSQIAASAKVLRNALEMPDRGIPKDLLRRCRAIAIFPSLFKVGVLVGVSYGNGIVLRKSETSGGWSNPAFFKIQNGSLGLQLGAQYMDLVLLIMSDGAVQRLLEDKFILGADIAVAAGPVGREASAETNIGFESGILSYSRTMGLFAGIALNGATIFPDREANEIYHGKGITVQDILYGEEGTLSDKARDLVQILQQATK